MEIGKHYTMVIYHQFVYTRDFVVVVLLVSWFLFFFWRTRLALYRKGGSRTTQVLWAGLILK